MVGIMLGGPDLKMFYGSHNAGVCIALLLLYVFAMSLVLLNCLIGIMADACSRVRSLCPLVELACSLACQNRLLQPWCTHSCIAD